MEPAKETNNVTRLPGTDVRELDGATGGTRLRHRLSMPAVVTVQAAVAVQRQRHVERADRRRVGPLAGQHVEEIRGVAQHRVWRDRAAARGRLVVCGNPRGT